MQKYLKMGKLDRLMPHKMFHSEKVMSHTIAIGNDSCVKRCNEELQLRPRRKVIRIKHQVKNQI